MKTFTIVSTRDQKKYVIETEATTMAELTADMTNAGISYEGMIFYEGLTKTTMDPTVGETILPCNIPYRGQTTDNLVFRLSLPQNKIDSGVDMSYKEMRVFIKEHDLMDKFKEMFNKNFTQGSTTEYKEFIDKFLTNEAFEFNNIEDREQRLAFFELLHILEEKHIITKEDINQILDAPEKRYQKESKKEKESPYSDNEISDLFKYLK